MKSYDGSLLCQDAATILPSHLSCVPCLPLYVFLLPLSLVRWSPCLDYYKESSPPEKKTFLGEGPEESLEDSRVDYAVVISTEASLVPQPSRRPPQPRGPITTLVIVTAPPASQRPLLDRALGLTTAAGPTALCLHSTPQRLSLHNLHAAYLPQSSPSD